MRCISGKRYARVFPEPVSAWMKASESSARSCVIVAFWIAVGALRSSFVRRCVASVGERPRDVNVERPSRRGAFDGAVGAASSSGALELGIEEVGLDVKREEMISPWGFEEWAWSCGAGTVFCRFCGRVEISMVSGLLVIALPFVDEVSGTALAPPLENSSERCWDRFLAMSLSFQRPPLKTAEGFNGVSGSEKFHEHPIICHV